MRDSTIGAATLTVNTEEDFWLERSPSDPKAFEYIYDRYLLQVTRYIYKKTGDRHTTEDLTSKVFIRVLESLLNGNYSHRGKFPAWLFTIVRTTIAEHFRNQNSHQLVDLHDDLPVPERAEPLAADTSFLEKCFNELDETEQELLALRFSAELEYKTIAYLLNKTTAGVKMATYRSMMKLRSKMEEQNEQEK